MTRAGKPFGHGEGPPSAPPTPTASAWLLALAFGRDKLGSATSETLDRALFAAVDGLMLQYPRRAITVEQLAASVPALGIVMSRDTSSSGVISEPIDRPRVA